MPRKKLKKNKIYIRMVGTNFKMELLKFKEYKKGSSFGMNYTFEEVVPSKQVTGIKNKGKVYLAYEELWLYDSVDEAIRYIKREAKKEFHENLKKHEQDFINKKLGFLLSEIDLSKIK